MMLRRLAHSWLLRPALLAGLWGAATAALADGSGADAELGRLRAAAAQQQPALVATLKQLVEIESGSADREGLERIATLASERLKALGGRVRWIEPGDDLYRMGDTPERVGPMVEARFAGRGQARILLLAHLDTVYPRGMLAEQPFRIEGDKAYGLGIADDKQGVALVLHLLEMLRGQPEWGELTVLFNSDEEISSPASRAHITRLGAEHDVVLSFEGGGGPAGPDSLRLATSGIAAAYLRVKGRAAHAGAAPERGVNAIYELSHQLLQARDLSDRRVGRQVHWTLARGGIVRNMIPPAAEASADIRVDRVADFDGIERTLRERIQNKLLPESEVTLDFERRRPPLQASEASRRLAREAVPLALASGLQPVVRDQPSGGGTDAAFAALQTRAPVIEGMGLRGAGAHTRDAEYVMLDSIVPRLLFGARLILAISRGELRGQAAP